MDLIYADENRTDIGVMRDYTFDLAYGADENNFECKIVRDEHCCDQDYILYIEGTEYGGIIDDIEVVTGEDEIAYSGRTWHGILNSKIIEPEGDHLILSGDANEAMATIVSRVGLDSLFRVSEEPSGITLSNYKMARYINAYDGIRKMLRSVSAKLNLKYEGGYVVLDAVPLVDYSEDEQFDQDLINFDIKRKFNPINHVICLGAGELSEREVIHVYADAEGHISDTQSIFGLDEVVAVYENTNAEGEELRDGGVDLLKESWESNELQFDFLSDSESFDIGDIVGATERITGVTVKTTIEKKIVNISNNMITVSYPSVNNGTTVVSGGGGGGGGGGEVGPEYVYQELDGAGLGVPIPVDAETLNGKTEGELSVADSARFGGQLPDYFASMAELASRTEPCIYVTAFDLGLSYNGTAITQEIDVQKDGYYIMVAQFHLCGASGVSEPRLLSVAFNGAYTGNANITFEPTWDVMNTSACYMGFISSGRYSITVGGHWSGSLNNTWGSGGQVYLIKI